MIGRIAIGLGLLALAASVGVVLWAWWRSIGKRRRLAEVYARAHLEPTIPRPPQRPTPAGPAFMSGGAGGGRTTYRAPPPRDEPLRPAYSSRSTDAPASFDWGPSLYADPGPLASSDPAPAFSGGGGEFGGAGASGGWDSGGGSSGDGGGGGASND